MKTILALLLIGISLSGTAQKHKQKDKKDHFTPMIVRGLGGSFQQFDGLNGRIAGFPQYEGLKNYAGTLSLGWLKEYKQFISGSGISIGSSMSGDRGKKSSTIRYIGLNADMGYDFLKNEDMMLYPMAGVGFQAYQALLYRDNSAINFDAVLQSPGLENSISAVKFTNSFLVYRLGFGISVKPPKCPASIGIQAGYTGSFKKHDWKTDENQVLNNSPEDRVSQFYVSLILMNKMWNMK